jgi:hypothetical protein
LFNFRFGSKADICSAKGHVRFAPESDAAPSLVAGRDGLLLILEFVRCEQSAHRRLKLDLDDAVCEAPALSGKPLGSATVAVARWRSYYLPGEISAVDHACGEMTNDHGARKAKNAGPK